EVTQVEESRFRVAELQTLNVEQQTVFVYGREVNDFHTVDYEAISMLNVSATQELYRLIQQQQREIDALKSQNNALKKEVTSLSGLQAKVAQIELALQRMNNIGLTSADNK
ncbi:MAG: hypothetical protein KDH84_22350, partial [Calditrichaeota bacterium]|nr:hypothetical protein [Calditrichota bacterium]